MNETELLLKAEAEKAALEAETEALGILLSNLVDVEAERDRLRELAKGASATCSPRWARLITEFFDASGDNAT